MDFKSNENNPEKSNEFFSGPEYANNVGADYLNLRKTTIYGGSTDPKKYTFKNGFRAIMNLSLSEDQALIRESAEKFLTLNYSFEKRREFLENKQESYKNNWKSFANLGWLGIAFSEDTGGFDGNINNLMTLMESMGAALVLEPLIFNNLIIGKFFETFSNENNKKYLKEIISGEKVYSFLFSPPENYKNIILNTLK